MVAVAAEAAVLANDDMTTHGDPRLSRPAGTDAAAAIAMRRPIVAFVTDDVSVVALQNGLNGVAQKLDIRRGSLQAATRFLEKTTELRALLVDVSGVEDPHAGLEALAGVCPPDVIVTAIGDNADIGFYRSLVHGLGISEYVPKPLTRDAVQTLLRPHLAGDEAETDSTRGGQVVAICGAQGGAGATSIAINLAMQLADTTKATVAILDLHLQDGESAVMLGVRPGSGLRIALEDPLRADALLLDRTAIEVDDRVRLIAAEEAIDEDIQITEAGMRHVLALMRRKFNYIVVDLPTPLPVAMRPVVTIARHIFVLLEPEVTGLRNALALRTTVRQLAGVNRVFTVLNRADRPGGLTRARVTKGLGGAPDMIIPDLGKRMTEAVNLGVPAVRRLPALRRHLAPMVREIAGVQTEAGGSWFRRLFKR